MAHTPLALRAMRLNEVFDKLKADCRVANRRHFAEEIGVKHGYLGPRFNGDADISDDFARRVQMAYGISAKWLLNGEGHMMISKKEKEQGIEDVYRLLQEMSTEIRQLKDRMWLLENLPSKK